MAKLTAKVRNSKPSSEFALPGERKYFIGDASHAANAKGRATQQAKKGNLTTEQKAKIVNAANKELAKARGRKK